MLAHHQYYINHTQHVRVQYIENVSSYHIYVYECDMFFFFFFFFAAPPTHIWDKWEVLSMLRQTNDFNQFEWKEIELNSLLIGNHLINIISEMVIIEVTMKKSKIWRSMEKKVVKIPFTSRTCLRLPQRTHRTSQHYNELRIYCNYAVQLETQSYDAQISQMFEGAESPQWSSGVYL